MWTRVIADAAVTCVSSRMNDFAIRLRIRVCSNDNSTLYSIKQGKIKQRKGKQRNAHSVVADFEPASVSKIAVHLLEFF